MKAKNNLPSNAVLSDAKIARLRTKLERCKEEILKLDWISEGSVGESHPGHWRWTRKVKAKTITVALSEEQSVAFAAAIRNHRRIERLIKDMRAISQNYLLRGIPGPPRRKSRKSVPTVP